MPVPSKGESKDDFISRCIPIVINEGTTDDTQQAAAICFSIWERKKKNGIVNELILKLDCVECKVDELITSMLK